VSESRKASLSVTGGKLNPINNTASNIYYACTCKNQSAFQVICHYYIPNVCLEYYRSLFVVYHIIAQKGQTSLYMVRNYCFTITCSNYITTWLENIDWYYTLGHNNKMSWFSVVCTWVLTDYKGFFFLLFPCACASICAYDGSFQFF
jgi:hypothetical protein